MREARHGAPDVGRHPLGRPHLCVVWALRRHLPELLECPLDVPTGDGELRVGDSHADLLGGALKLADRIRDVLKHACMTVSVIGAWK